MKTIHLSSYFNKIPSALCYAFLLSTIFAARVDLISNYGAPVLKIDEFHAIGDQILTPIIDGNINPSSFFKPWHEHRILTTRIWTYVLIILNRQYDTMLIMTMNILPLAGVALVAIRIATRLLPPRFSVPLSLFIVYIFAQPIFYYNTLWAFQVEFYFFLLYSILFVVGIGFSRLRSLMWYAGLLSGILLPFTMASAFVPAFITLLLHLNRRRHTSPSPKEANAGIAISSACLVLCIFFVTLPAKEHVGDYPDFSICSSIIFMARQMAFPYTFRPYMFPFIAAPFLFVLIRLLYSRRKLRRHEEFGLILCIFSLMQMFLLAASRRWSPFDMSLQPRHFDLFLFWSLGNGVCLFSILSTWTRSKNKHFASCLSATWFVVFIAANSWVSSFRFVETVQRFRSSKTAQIQHMRSDLGRVMPYENSSRRIGWEPWLPPEVSEPDISILGEDNLASETIFTQLENGLHSYSGWEIHTYEQNEDFETTEFSTPTDFIEMFVRGSGNLSIRIYGGGEKIVSITPDIPAFHDREAIHLLADSRWERLVIPVPTSYSRLFFSLNGHAQFTKPRSLGRFTFIRRTLSSELTAVLVMTISSIYIIFLLYLLWKTRVPKI